MRTKTITIPQKEYQMLREKSTRYDEFREIMRQDPFSSPPTRNAEDVVKAFRATKKYSRGFLIDLKRGLEHSSYFVP